MNIGIFLRCPVSVAERIRGAIIRENVERAASKLDAFALYRGQPCLPPYFARAGEREIERIESAARLAPRDGLPIATRVWSNAHEATLNVNFDVSPALAARAGSAIRVINKALLSAQGEPICLRSGEPSLPRFFLRAGLLELERDEARLPEAPASTSARARSAASLHAGASGRRGPRRGRVDGPPRAEVVRALLRRGPATMDDLVRSGLTRYHARNTISGLITKGEVFVERHTETSRRGNPIKPLYALREIT